MLCCSLFALLFVATFANAQCGGRLPVLRRRLRPNNPNADGLANENDAIVSGSPYGAATYQNFTFAVRSATATGLFTNNLSGLNPSTGYWEIRTGVSEGNGGTLVASGTGAITHTATGRSGFGFTEYRDEVDGLNSEPDRRHPVLVRGCSERSEQCEPFVQQQHLSA